MTTSKVEDLEKIEALRISALERLEQIGGDSARLGLTRVLALVALLLATDNS